MGLVSQSCHAFPQDCRAWSVHAYDGVVGESAGDGLTPEDASRSEEADEEDEVRDEVRLTLAQAALDGGLERALVAAHDKTVDFAVDDGEEAPPLAEHRCRAVARTLEKRASPPPQSLCHLAGVFMSQGACLAFQQQLKNRFQEGKEACSTSKLDRVSSPEHGPLRHELSRDGVF